MFRSPERRRWQIAVLEKSAWGKGKGSRALELWSFAEMCVRASKQVVHFFVMLRVRARNFFIPGCIKHFNVSWLSLPTPPQNPDAFPAVIAIRHYDYARILEFSGGVALGKGER